MTSSASASRPDVDYHLYLVTDSTPAILGDRDICDVVEKALRGGVTLVQYRDKTSDTGVLISTATRLHEITKKYRVPLLINDRVDVALAVGCEGVHLGQDDMDIHVARKLLGEDKIIGITANNADEAVKACEQGADYLGVGTIFSTQTKTNTKSVIGPEGLRHTLAVLKIRDHEAVPVVCIGGLKASNVFQVMFRGNCLSNPLSGVAVVSAIMGADDPEAAARHLLNTVVRSDRLDRLQFTLARSGVQRFTTIEHLRTLVPRVITAVHEEKPLTHNMTNLVVQNFAANVALCVGASPIMSNNGDEAADFAQNGGALVINMGTATPDALENYKKALRAYNVSFRPVIFDPVGVGASAIRRAAAKDIMATGYIDVIKGNESEIKAIYGSQDTQRGVDSSSTLTLEQKQDMVCSLALRERNIVVMTGKIDMVSNGDGTFAVHNGHEYLGAVTGTGCTLGTAISAMVAAWYDHDRLAAVLAAVLLFNIAAERAAAKDSVKGPGTFVPAFLDALFQLRNETAQGDLKWMDGAKVSGTSL